MIITMETEVLVTSVAYFAKTDNWLRKIQN